MNEIYEEDVLSIYKKYLLQDGYTVLSCNGVQGQYFYQIPGGRKFPDIIAVKNDVLLLGEGKVKPEDIFINKGNISDYDSIIYLKENPKILSHFVAEIGDKLRRMRTQFNPPLKVKYVFCASGTFGLLKNKIDRDINLAEVDMINSKITVTNGLK